jgi:hypothetical protein
MKDSFKDRDAAVCNTSGFLCGYHSASRPCDPEQNVKENQEVVIVDRRGHQAQATSTRDTENRALESQKYRQAPAPMPMQGSNKKKPGIKDFVTSVSQNQQNNGLVIHQNQKNIPFEQDTSTITSPMSSPMTKNSGTTPYSPGEQEIPSTSAKQIHTPSNFDNGDQSEGVHQQEHT